MNLPLEPTNGGTFEAVTVTNDHTLVVKIRGELDLCTVDMLRAALSGFTANGHRAALLDLSGLTFCDVAGVRELDRLHHVLRDLLDGVSFRIASPLVRRMIELTRADIELPLDEPNP